MASRAWRKRTGFCGNTTSRSSIAAFRCGRRNGERPFCPGEVRTWTSFFSLQFERAVNRDNTVSFQHLSLQIEPVRWRASLAGCTVKVHQHLDGTLTITHGPQRLGRYSAEGKLLGTNRRRHGLWKSRGMEKSNNRLFHPAWKSRKVRGIPTFPQPRRRLVDLTTGHIVCYKNRTF